MVALLGAACACEPVTPVTDLLSHPWTQAAAAGNIPADWPTHYQMPFAGPLTRGAFEYSVREDDPALTGGSFGPHQAHNKLRHLAFTAELNPGVPSVAEILPVLRAEAALSANAEYLNISAWMRRVRGHRRWTSLHGRTVTAEELLARPGERHRW